MKRLLALLLLLIASPAWGAITFDAQYEGAGTSTDTVSYTHTVGSPCANPIIVVGIQARPDGSATINTMTIGGAAGTLIDTQDVAGWVRQAWLYRRVGVSTGSNTITVVFGASNEYWHVTSLSYCGVDQAAPTGTAAKTSQTTQGVNDPSVNVTSAVGEVVVDSMIQTDNNDAGCGPIDGIERDNTRVSFIANFGMHQKAGAASVTMNWSCDSDDVWGIVAVPLKPAAALRRIFAPIIFQ